VLLIVSCEQGQNVQLCVGKTIYYVDVTGVCVYIYILRYFVESLYGLCVIHSVLIIKHLTYNNKDLTNIQYTL